MWLPSARRWTCPTVVKDKSRLGTVTEKKRARPSFRPSARRTSTLDQLKSTFKAYNDDAPPWGGGIVGLKTQRSSRSARRRAEENTQACRCRGGRKLVGSFSGQPTATAGGGLVTYTRLAGEPRARRATRGCAKQPRPSTWRVRPPSTRARSVPLLEHVAASRRSSSVAGSGGRRRKSPHPEREIIFPRAARHGMSCARRQLLYAPSKRPGSCCEILGGHSSRQGKGSTGTPSIKRDERRQDA